MFDIDSNNIDNNSNQANIEVNGRRLGLIVTPLSNLSKVNKWYEDLVLVYSLYKLA